jgi:hypothetical protein
MNPGRTQLGLAAAILLTRSRISRLTGGLPGPLDLNFQKSLNPLRCQCTTVSGFTMTRDLGQGVQIRESTTQKSRSAIRIFGRLYTRFITANCWRSARFSAARFEVILNFDQMNKTRFPCVFIMLPAWQAHANLSMISESTNNCEGHPWGDIYSPPSSWLSLSKLLISRARLRFTRISIGKLMCERWGSSPPSCINLPSP